MKGRREGMWPQPSDLGYVKETDVRIMEGTQNLKNGLAVEAYVFTYWLCTSF